MIALRKILRRVSKQRTPRTSSPLDRATEQDLYYCYRLLLHREPDEAGWAFYAKQIKQHQLSLKSLTDAFIDSPEFLSKREQVHYTFFLRSARQIQLARCDGFSMYARANDRFIGAPIIRGELYEAHIVRELHQLLKPGMAFVDLGANIGYFSLLAAALVGPTGRVMAFEPNLENCELIKLSIRANQFEHAHVHPFAVSDREQDVLLEIYGSNGAIIPEAEAHQRDLTHTQSLDDDESAVKFILAKAIVLDDFLRDTERIDVIKIDIEGGELRALQGMSALIERHRPVIVSEFAPTMLERQSGVNGEAYLRELHEREYDLHVIGPEKIHLPAQSRAEIMEYYFQTGGNHIDLIAFPKR
jgi:FkbM family methyltransferase